MIRVHDISEFRWRRSLSPFSCALSCLLQENTETNVHRLNLMGRKICVDRFLNVQHVHISSSMYTCSFSSHVMVYLDSWKCKEWSVLWTWRWENVNMVFLNAWQTWKRSLAGEITCFTWMCLFYDYLQRRIHSWACLLTFLFHLGGGIYLK